MNKQTYSHGKLLTSKAFPSHKLTEQWIQDKHFLKCETTELLLGKKSRKRNKLYCFYYLPTGCNVIMKVSQISEDYRFRRKVNLFITNLFKDYNYRSYIGSMRLHHANVDTIKPIAYWTFKRSWLKRKSYILYQKVEDKLTVSELCNNIAQSNGPNKDELVNTIAIRCVEIVKKIHAANIRHDDPHGGNILTNLNYQDVTELGTENINNARFTLIDNDRCTSARTLPKALKRFFDLKCLVRLSVCGLSRQKLLHLYLGEEYKAYWWYVLSFWSSGGFSVRKRINFVLKQVSILPCVLCSLLM